MPNILSISVQTIPTTDGKIKPYVSGMVESTKGVVTQKFYPIAQASDTHNMKRDTVYAMVETIQNHIRLVIRVKYNDGLSGIGDAFTLPNSRLTTTKQRPIQVTTQIPPDCIEDVRKMHIPERAEKNKPKT